MKLYLAFRFSLTKWFGESDFPSKERLLMAVNCWWQRYLSSADTIELCCWKLDQQFRYFLGKSFEAVSEAILRWKLGSWRTVLKRWLASTWLSCCRATVIWWTPLFKKGLFAKTDLLSLDCAWPWACCWDLCFFVSTPFLVRQCKREGLPGYFGCCQDWCLNSNCACLSKPFS